MKSIVFIDTSHTNLLPLTYTRPVSELRVGILTIAEKWAQRLNLPFSNITQPYLQAKFPHTPGEDQLVLAGGLLPDEELLKTVQSLKMNEVLMRGETFIAARTGNDKFSLDSLSNYKTIPYSSDFSEVCYPWNIFSFNGQEIINDFELLTKGRKSAGIDGTNRVAGKENVFIEDEATVRFATINAERGPVYIGTGAEIMENSVIRGPFAILPGGVVKMGAKIYGPTTIGPVCKVGGEVNNSVFQGYSNKGHDGFLGNSVIGEWCNLGADTNNSNLKNNYAEVRVWNYQKELFIQTGLQFCGLIMGDHSKCGINTMFNTGTVVGVSANIFGSGFPRNLVPSFSWGGAGGFAEFKMEKALEVVERVYDRRGKKLDQIEIDILTHIYEQTAKYRKFQ
ncbi:MAG: GlmU family protein [Salinivirgaceae bacterium]|jgi:UDP-N-acetylglucosamine diphosphorylase/glucosamine-1-phosphate N-acetyltransferase|nr:GlmU family protein [Salinivirgaceae bacterium]